MTSNHNKQEVVSDFVHLAPERGVLKGMAFSVCLLSPVREDTYHDQEEGESEKINSVSRDSEGCDVSSELLLLNIEEPAEQASSMPQNRKSRILTTPKSNRFVPICHDFSNDDFAYDVLQNRSPATDNNQRLSSLSVSKVQLKPLLKMKRRRLSDRDRDHHRDRDLEDFCIQEGNVSQDKEDCFPLPKRLFLNDIEEDVKRPTRRWNQIPLKLPDCVFLPKVDDFDEDDWSNQDSFSTSNFSLKPRFKRKAKIEATNQLTTMDTTATIR